MTTFALYICIILSIGSLYWEYFHAGFDSTSRWVAIIGVIWLLSQWKRWDWFSSWMLFLCVLMSAIGLVMGLNFGWMTAGSIFALFAWDMTDFRKRLKYSVIDENMRGVERRHLARLSLLTLAGLLLVSLALFLQFKFTYEWGVFLVIVLVAGLMQLAGWIRK